MFNRSFLNLFSLVVLNSIGAGILNLVPSLAPFGINSFIAWNLSAIGCFSVVMALLKVGTFYKLEDYAIQNLIAAPFGKKTAEVLSKSVFWGYLVFGVAGNGAIAISMMIGLKYFFPYFITSYEVTCFYLIFSVFYILNRFGINFSKNVNLFLFTLKILIMCIFPMLAIFFLPSKVPFTTVFQAPMILRATFLTIWPFVGIESVLMERDVDRRSFVPAMIAGLGACLFINILNNYIMLANIDNLAKCTSPYLELFNLVFPGSQLASILVNLAIIMMTFGSLYGWIYIGVAGCMSAEQYIPPPLMAKNRYGIPEIMLFFCCFSTPTGFAIIKKCFPKTNAFEFIIDMSVAMILVIYALGVVAFGLAKVDSCRKYLEKYRNQETLPQIKHPFISWFRKNLFDFSILLLATTFVIFAFIGSDFYPTMVGLGLFVLPFLYFSIS